ncbi:MAG: response regulator [Anaerolineae bacterium]|nr:response regulator [Anaerolineae bacterium]
MAEEKDTVYLVDANDDERNLLAEMALEPFGYVVRTAAEGNAGLSMVLEGRPDVLLLDLHPRGMSGVDVLAALSAQSIDIPVIVLADEGAEKEALKAFRLGARDYLVRPIREAEMIQAVERALKDVRLKRERASLVSEVRHADEEAEQRLRENKTLMGIGKSVTSLHSLDEIFDRVVRAAIQLTRADAAGLMVRDDQGRLLLRAGQNLPRELLDRVGQPVDDDLAALVLRSHEPYLASGEGLRKFRPVMSGASAVIYAPLVVNESAFGLLWVGNARVEFAPHMRDIMSALADYAAIAIFNVRLVAAVRERAVPAVSPPAPAAPASGRGAEEVARTLRGPLTELMANMNRWRTGELGPIPPGNQAAVDVMHRQLSELIALIDTVAPPEPDSV